MGNIKNNLNHRLQSINYCQGTHAKSRSGLMIKKVDIMLSLSRGYLDNLWHCPWWPKSGWESLKYHVIICHIHYLSLFILYDIQTLIIYVTIMLGSPKPPPTKSPRTKLAGSHRCRTFSCTSYRIACHPRELPCQQRPGCQTNFALTWWLCQSCQKGRVQSLKLKYVICFLAKPCCSLKRRNWRPRFGYMCNIWIHFINPSLLPLTKKKRCIFNVYVIHCPKAIQTTY